MTSDHLLVVDDEVDFANGLARLLRSQFPDLTVSTAHGGQEALDILAVRPVSVLLTDLRMPGLSGLELLGLALAREPAPTVIMLTAHGAIETAVQAIKAGAYDFLTKPIDADCLARVVGKGLERSRLLGENQRLRRLAAQADLDQVLIGESPPMRRLKETIAAVAASDYDALIQGESGTGKELTARAIHRLSRRAHKPLVTVNCPAIPDQLLESELFGHVKGAFTGADRARRGLFLAAHGGTLFLDEIGDVSMNVQTRLLRALQEREIRPVGASQSLQVDVRILASTNQDLERKIAERTFREDLFYRLNVLSVRTPPLRDRLDDAPLLAVHLLRQACRETGIAAKEFAPDALAALAARPWPGNVRELFNHVRRLTVFCPAERIDLPLMKLAESGQACGPAAAGPPVAEPYKEAKERVLEEFTRGYVTELLTRVRGNVSEAARQSGLERFTLQKILKRLGLEAESFRQP